MPKKALSLESQDGVKSADEGAELNRRKVLAYLSRRRRFAFLLEQ